MRMVYDMSNNGTDYSGVERFWAVMNLPNSPGYMGGWGHLKKEQFSPILHVKYINVQEKQWCPFQCW